MASTKRAFESVKRLRNLNPQVLRVLASICSEPLKGGPRARARGYNLAAPSGLSALLRGDKGERIPPEVTPILEVRQIDADAWVKDVELYGKLFYRMAGRAEKLVEAANAAGVKWCLRGGRDATRSSATQRCPRPSGGRASSATR